jgi:hypothetical protein
LKESSGKAIMKHLDRAAQAVGGWMIIGVVYCCCGWLVKHSTSAVGISRKICTPEIFSSVYI